MAAVDAIAWLRQLVALYRLAPPLLLARYTHIQVPRVHAATVSLVLFPFYRLALRLVLVRLFFFVWFLAPPFSRRLHTPVWSRRPVIRWRWLFAPSVCNAWPRLFAPPLTDT